MVRVFRIAALSDSEGSPTYRTLSSLPGLRTAGSIMSAGRGIERVNCLWGSGEEREGGQLFLGTEGGQLFSEQRGVGNRGGQLFLEQRGVGCF